MKDFIKWLGVNEKVAKVVVWMMIIMVCLIIINTALTSLGFPHYAITYDNFKNMDLGKLANRIIRCIVCILNFYSILLLIFRIKDIKRLFKWGILYMILNWIIFLTSNYVLLQIFIFLFFILFPFFYSGKKIRYIFFGLVSLIINTVIQGICYYYKASLIDLTSISAFTQSLLSMDYFIIMAIIILVKEIYLKKRGVN